LEWTALLVAEDEYADTHAAFQLFKHESWSLDDAPLFWRRGSDSNCDPTEDPHEAESNAAITVKWDGCGQMALESLHICDRKHIENFAAALLRCHDWAREIGMDRL